MSNGVPPRTSTTRTTPFPTRARGFRPCRARRAGVPAAIRRAPTPRWPGRRTARSRSRAALGAKPRPGSSDRPGDHAAPRHRRGVVRPTSAGRRDGARSRRPRPDHRHLGVPLACPCLAAHHRGRRLAVDRHRMVHRAAHADHRRARRVHQEQRGAGSRRMGQEHQRHARPNGSLLPYGSVTSTNFRTVNGWANNGDENFDYGAIIIPTELGNTVGWFGFGVWPDFDPVGRGQHLRLSRWTSPREPSGTTTRRSRP